MQILHAGSDGFALEINAPIALNDVSLSDNAAGVFVEAVGLDADSSNLNITGTEDVPLTVEPNALVSIPVGGDLSGNATDQVLIQGGSYGVQGRVANLGIPYRVDGDIDVTDGGSMTIDAGVAFVMTANTDIQFGFAGYQHLHLPRAQGTG